MKPVFRPASKDPDETVRQVKQPLSSVLTEERRHGIIHPEEAAVLRETRSR